MSPGSFEDKGHFRRKFPRRAFLRAVGVIGLGDYSIFRAGEIGEGGMSITGEYLFAEDQEIVVSFQIPGGDFVSLRADVRSVAENEQGHNDYGLAFKNVSFTHRRQIRLYVSTRNENEQIFT